MPRVGRVHLFWGWLLKPRGHSRVDNGSEPDLPLKVLYSSAHGRVKPGRDQRGLIEGLGFHIPRAHLLRGLGGLEIKLRQELPSDDPSADGHIRPRGRPAQRVGDGHGGQGVTSAVLWGVGFALHAEGGHLALEWGRMGGTSVFHEKQMPSPPQLERFTERATGQRVEGEFRRFW